VDTVQNQPLIISGDGRVTRTDTPLRPIPHRFETNSTLYGSYGYAPPRIGRERAPTLAAHSLL
jgi:hypothetical protein